MFTVSKGPQSLGEQIYFWNKSTMWQIKLVSLKYNQPNNVSCMHTFCSFQIPISGQGGRPSTIYTDLAEETLERLIEEVIVKHETNVPFSPIPQIDSYAVYDQKFPVEVEEESHEKCTNMDEIEVIQENFFGTLYQKPDHQRGKV